MDMKLKAYGAYAKEVYKWVHDEFAFASKEEQVILLDKAMRPIAYWDGSDAVQAGQKEMRKSSPSTLIEKYPDELDPISDKRIKMRYIEDAGRFAELMSDARKDGWHYNRDERELVKS